MAAGAGAAGHGGGGVAEALAAAGVPSTRDAGVSVSLRFGSHEVAAGAALDRAATAAAPTVHVAGAAAGKLYTVRRAGMQRAWCEPSRTFATGRPAAGAVAGADVAAHCDIAP